MTTYIPKTDKVSYYSKTDYIVIGKSGKRYVRDNRCPNNVQDYAQVIDWTALTDYELQRAQGDLLRRSSEGNMFVDSNSDSFIEARLALFDERARRRDYKEGEDNAHWWACIEHPDRGYMRLGPEDGTAPFNNNGERARCTCGGYLIRGQKYQEPSILDTLWCAGRPSPCDRKKCPHWDTCSCH